MAQLYRQHQDMPHVVGTLPHWIEGVYLITRVEADSASDGVSLARLASLHLSRSRLCSFIFVIYVSRLPFARQSHVVYSR